MISEKEKKEMLEDALSEERRKAFEEADKKAEEFIQKYQSFLAVDRVVKFLMDAQEVTGPFPVSKAVPSPPFNFRL